jgi:hypothetical protein
MSVNTGNYASLLHSGRELFKDLLGVFPIDAGICDANAIFQVFFAFLGYLLVSCKLLA